MVSVLCSTDSKYCAYCGVMLYSVFCNHKPGEVEAFIMSAERLPSRVISKFEKMARSFNDKVSFVPIDDSALKSYYIKGNDYWSMVTYYRIFAADVLPETVEKILYLDCDIVVDGDLSDLWNIDMTSYSGGVIPDICTSFDDNYIRLQYDKVKGYFNAGVIFMNLSYWRQHHLGKQCLEYLENHFDRVLWNDQDVLNYVMKDSKYILSAKYNFQIKYLSSTYFDSFPSFLKLDVDASRYNPTIVHYAMPMKPWMINYYILPFNQLWHDYKKRSPWRFKIDKLPSHKKVNYLIKRFVVWPLGKMTSTDFSQ